MLVCAGACMWDVCVYIERIPRTSLMNYRKIFYCEFVYGFSSHVCASICFSAPYVVHLFALHSFECLFLNRK